MKKRIIITESQYSKILKELERDMETPDVGYEEPHVSNVPEEPLDQDEIEHDVEDDLEYENMAIEKRVEFLEEFLRDLLDLQEFMVNRTNDAFKEISGGEVAIPGAKEKFERITTRGGRKKFYTAKRGLR